MRKPGAVQMLRALACVWLLAAAAPAADRTFATRFSTNDTGDIAIVANTSMTASSNGALNGNAANVVSIQNGTNGTASNLNNNNNYMTNVDVDADGTTFNSSSATLNLPPGATVLFAGLYWGADTSAGAAVGSPVVAAGVAAPSAASKSQVKFGTPGAGYTTLTATQVDTPTSNTTRYSCFVAVTAQVAAGGNGSYTIANIQAGLGADRFGGWSLVVAYRAPGLQPKNLVVFDGMATVSNGAPVNIAISGFTAPASGAVNVKMGVVTYEGDRGTTGDQMSVNGTAIIDAANPSSNSFNCSISANGANVTTKSPDYVNQLGYDSDLFTIPNSGNVIIANNATSATIALSSTGDVYYPAVVTSAIDLYAPQITAGKTFTDLNGDNVTPGDILEYVITIANTAGDAASACVLRDPIPANTTYVAGSIQVTAGANTGVKTDALSDDQGEFEVGNNRVVVRLGTGANGTTGGSLAIGASTTVKFRARVNIGVPDGTQLSNQASFSFNSLASGLALASSTNSASVQNSVKVQGTVFEDVNYGGGAGRDLAASAGVARPGARIELFNSSGNFVQAATTDATGKFSFPDLAAGNYTVRCVSGTVVSSRPGGGTAGLAPVQTFVNGDAQRVGGEDPSRADAGNGATTLAALATAATVAQSVTTVVVGTSDVLRVDFGYNFDTIVSTRDAGQGSLRQFLANSNALGNTGLAQSGLTAGRETSLFMISDGAAHPGLRAGLANQLTGGVATIAPASVLPPLTDAATGIDGTTQTANIGDTNAGTAGAGGAVGVDALALGTVAKPEVQISAALATGLDLQAANATVRGIALFRFVKDIVVGANGAVLAQNFIGSAAAAFADPGTRSGSGVFGAGGDSAAISGNLIGFTAASAVMLTSASDSWVIQNNEIRGAAGGDGIEITGASGAQITGNLLTANSEAGLVIAAGVTTAQVVNNTISASAGTDGLRDAGSGGTFTKNVLTGNARNGAQLDGASATVSLNTIAANNTGGIRVSGNNNRLTQNSIYGNSGSGIDLGAAGVSANDGVTAGGGNSGLDYPVFTATLSGATLTVRGFVGNSPNQTIFGGASIEIFKADNAPADQNGEVLAGDGRSVAHGEGRTYLGTITAAANGALNSTLTVSGVVLGDILTATATNAAGSTSEFSANTAVTVVPTYDVSGVVYLDANHNAKREPAENGTGLAQFMKLVPAASPAGPALQAVTVNATLGAFVFSGVAAGDYRLVLDDNATLSDVTPTIPAGWSGTETATQTRAVTVLNIPVSNLNFGLIQALAITGTIFADLGGGTGGAANDGLKNGSESGIAGLTVKLTDASGATVYDTAITNATGDYTLLLPQSLAAGTVLKVVATNGANTVSTGGSAGTTGGSYDRTADAVTFSFSPNTTYSGVNFGDAPDIVFTTDGAQANLPGSFATYPHTFTAGSAGSVIFATASAPAPVVSGWSATLFRDVNGNGQLDNGDTPITGALALTAGQTVQILVKEIIPSAAPFNAQDKLMVTATFTFTGATPALTATASHLDLTTVGNPTTAGLVLVKSVDKPTALPGEVIAYTITFMNNSSAALGSVVIFDNTPAFTTFASATNGPLPAGLTAVALTAPGVGASGAVRWTFTGALQPGATGTVTFRVTLAQ